MLYIGSHVSYLKDKQLLRCIEESMQYCSNIFMFYTGSIQSTLRFPVDLELTKKAHGLMKTNDFDRNEKNSWTSYKYEIENLKNKKFNDFII